MLQVSALEHCQRWIVELRKVGAGRPLGGLVSGDIAIPITTQAVVREVVEELGIPAKLVAKVWECPTE